MSTEGGRRSKKSQNLVNVVCERPPTLGWFKTPVSSQTDKLMAGTKFSNYLGLNHYKKVKKLKHFIHLGLAQGPQSFATYRSISPSGNLGNQLKNHVLVM